MRQSIPRQVDKKSGFPEEEKGVWVLKEEIEVWNSQGGEKRTNFFSTFLSKDYITIMYLA